jgi:hypothetical protein
MNEFFKKLFNKLFRASEVTAQDVTIKADAPTPESYISKRLPALPYDENSKHVHAPVLAIVDETGHIIGYLPLAAEINSDGTASIKVISD